MGTAYNFVTKWEIQASVNDVWNAIYHSEEWPLWWRGVTNVSIIDGGDVNGIGGIRRYTWKSILPYSLSFNLKLTDKIPLQKLAGVAFGELEGEGVWYFKQEHDVTHVEYHWIVVTNKAWMNAMAFILKPLFNYNHDVIMKWGAKGLAKKLQAKLLAY